jgi:hypothetical protein
MVHRLRRWVGASHFGGARVDSKNPSNNLSIIKNCRNIRLRYKKDRSKEDFGWARHRETAQIPAKIGVVHWRSAPIPMPLRLFFFLAFDRDLFFQTC